MNWNQIYGILRIVLPSVATYAIGKSWITQDMYTQIGGALAAIVAAGGFSAAANTNLSLSKAVSAVPGVQVAVDYTAPIELQRAAADRSDQTVKDIVPVSPATPRK